MTPEHREAQAARMRAMHVARKAAGLPPIATGHRNSPETRARMSELAKQRYSEGRCGAVGKPLSPEHEAKFRAAQKAFFQEHPRENEAHHNWKGDRAGYGAVHDWVKRRLVRTHACAFCGRETPWTDIANLDHQYRRDLADWRELCRSCHRRWDKAHGLEVAGGQKARFGSR